MANILLLTLPYYYSEVAANQGFTEVPVAYIQGKVHYGALSNHVDLIIKRFTLHPFAEWLFPTKLDFSGKH